MKSQLSTAICFESYIPFLELRIEPRKKELRIKPRKIEQFEIT